MTISKFEQSGLLIELDNGFKLALDVGSYTHSDSLTAFADVEAFLVSHIHGDHFDPQNIDALQPKKVYLNQVCIDNLPDGSDLAVERIQPGWTTLLGPIKITAYEADHGPNTGAPVIDNMSFVLEMEDKRIFFAGDMYYPSGLDVTTQTFDVAFIPIDGYYTFSPQAAIDYAKTFAGIGLLVPIHYHVRPPALNEFLDLAKDQLPIPFQDIPPTESIQV